MKAIVSRYGSCLFVFLLVVAATNTARGQTGPPYDLSHSVIAGGGEKSTGTNAATTFTLEGTIGQPLAGTVSTNASPRFALHGGFWYQSLSPTAAPVSVSGRVRTASGRGIRGVVLTLIAPNGARRTAITSTFGYYAFSGLDGGGTFILEVAAKRYTFANPVNVITATEDVTNADFTANEP